jgi:hypothetical protein
MYLDSMPVKQSNYLREAGENPPLAGENFRHNGNLEPSVGFEHVAGFHKVYVGRKTGLDFFMFGAEVPLFVYGKGMSISEPVKGPGLHLHVSFLSRHDYQQQGRSKEQRRENYGHLAEHSEPLPLPARGIGLGPPSENTAKSTLFPLLEQDNGHHGNGQYYMNYHQDNFHASHLPMRSLSGASTHSITEAVL